MPNGDMLITRLNGRHMDQERDSIVGALAKYMPIGVEARQERDTLVREYIVNSCECHKGG